VQHDLDARRGATAPKEGEKTQTETKTETTKAEVHQPEQLMSKKTGSGATAATINAIALGALAMFIAN